MLYPTPFKIYNFDNQTQLNAEAYDNNTFINAINSTLQKTNDDIEPSISKLPYTSFATATSAG